MGQKMGVKVSDEQLDQAIANIAKQNNMTRTRCVAVWPTTDAIPPT
ncbi:hypothetical protein ACNKHO_00435 [Shigella flexneri]